MNLKLTGGWQGGLGAAARKSAISNIRVMRHGYTAFRRLATECGSRRMLSYYSRIEVRRIPGFHDRAAPVFEVAEVVEKQVSDAVL